MLNLRENNYIVINFVNDIYLYALAALKDPNSQIGLTSFPNKYYSFHYLESHAMDIPYIKKSWGILIGKVSKTYQKSKQDSLGEVMIPVFILDVIFAQIFRNTFNHINRADNLVIESIILSTRLKIVTNLNNNELFHQIRKQINSNLNNIERFGKNKRALKAVEIVRNYVNKLIE